MAVFADFTQKICFEQTSCGHRPIRLTQCCTQFKPFVNKTFCKKSGISYHLNVNETL